MIISFFDTFVNYKLISNKKPWCYCDPIAVGYLKLHIPVCATYD
jgi:hypothetical protein